MARFVLGLLIELLDPHFLDAFIHFDLALVQVFIESGFGTGKRIALMTIIDLLLLMALAHAAVAKKFTLLHGDNPGNAQQRNSRAWP